MITEQLPPTDVTPGVIAPAVDFATLSAQFARIERDISNLWPVVKRNGGLFALYHSSEAAKAGRVTVQAQDAQGIQDYCEATLPKGTKIQWVIWP